MPSGGEDGTRTSSVNWGQWRWPQSLDPPRSSPASSREVRSGVRHKVTGSLSKSRGIQTSSPILEFAGADGSNAAVSGRCSPPHACHSVVPEATLDPHNPQVASSNLCQQGSGTHAPLMVGQVAPVKKGILNITITITMDESMEVWGDHCIVPGSRHITLQWPLDKGWMLAPNKCVRAHGSPPDPPASEAGSPGPSDLDWVWQHYHSVVHKQTRGSGLHDLQRWGLLSVLVVNPQINPGQGDTLTSCQWVSRLSVVQSPRPHRTAPLREGGIPAVSAVDKPQVDLFTSHLNHQLPLWFCWTGHPLVMVSNALSQPWTWLEAQALNQTSRTAIGTSWHWFTSTDSSHSSLFHTFPAVPQGSPVAGLYSAGTIDVSFPSWTETPTVSGNRSQWQVTWCTSCRFGKEVIHVDCWVLTIICQG